MEWAFTGDRWRNAALIGLTVLFLWFLALRKCLMFWPWNWAAIIVLLPPALLFTFILVNGKGRVVLIIAVLLCGHFFLPPHLDPMPIAASESGAVRILVLMSRSPVLRKQSSAIEDEAELSGWVGQFYRFERQQDENEVSAILLPIARSCGCVRNFTITSDGVLHYTMEPRPAGKKDPKVEIPTSLVSALSK
jgi:hypothetical protein